MPVKLQAAVLLLPIWLDSTQLVSVTRTFFAAEMYKLSSLRRKRIIRSEEGVITAYDGEHYGRIYRRSQEHQGCSFRHEDSVCRFANHQSRPAKSNFTMKHVVGVDTSDLFVAKDGCARSQ